MLQPGCQLRCNDSTLRRTRSDLPWSVFARIPAVPQVARVKLQDSTGAGPLPAHALARIVKSARLAGVCAAMPCAESREHADITRPRGPYAKPITVGSSILLVRRRGI